jgi:phosphatidate cytidylyltransferase
MLKTRIVTAVLLVLAFLSALFYLPTLGWVVFATIIAAIATWEWGILMGLGNVSRVFLAVTLICVCAGIAASEPAALGLEAGTPDAAWLLGRWFYIPAGVFWVIIVPLWMKYGWSMPKSVLGFGTGMLLILPTWLALLQLRQMGALFLLAIMAIVWIADIGAYFFGRTLGRHKLAPSISPGKTWEGALGGGFAVIVYGFILSPRIPVEVSGNYALLFLVFALLTVISIVGDLFESLLKRKAGLKDSSSILPGHGGVLDRIDSLTSTLPLVAFFWLYIMN